MKKFLILVVFMAINAGLTFSDAQTKVSATSISKVWVYYFHPNERCPIDQSIEANTKTVMKSFFSNETGNGTIVFKVINTDEKINAKLIAKFDINAQALYIVKLEKGKEIQKDLTRFAFDYSQSNPGKYKAGLKAEVEQALK